MSNTEQPPPYTNPTAVAMNEIIEAVTDCLSDCYSNWDIIYEPDGKPTFDEYLQHHFIEEALMSQAYGVGTAHNNDKYCFSYSKKCFLGAGGKNDSQFSWH